jgi:hypothetical protein
MTGTHYCATLKPASKEASYLAAITENPDNAPKKNPDEFQLLVVADHTRLWKQHRWLTIKFMDNPPEALQDAIEKVIWELDPHVNLLFGLYKGDNADIRISTNTTYNASAVGTDALLVEADQPTMYLGVKQGDSAFRQTILHEFCHALGLEHEHQHPKANIPWNEAKVYELGRSMGWSKDKTYANFFETLQDGNLTITEYDQTSIMHYPVDKELTDGVFEVGINSELSTTDIFAIQSLYPK